MKPSRNVIRPLLMGMALLTRIPTTQWLPQHWEKEEIARSALYYPLIGVLMALVLSLCAWLLPDAVSPWVGAIMVLLVWVLFSGGLHLDGLADCVDALYAGHSVVEQGYGDKSPKRDKIFHVLKDPRAGSMAVITLCLLLMAKFVLLASLWESLGVSVLLAIVISRSMAVIFMSYTPYTPFASSAGIGAVIAAHIDKSAVVLVHCLLFGLALMLLPFTTVFWLTLVLAGWLLLWRRHWLKLMGGFVGDTVGALIEVAELLVLFVVYLTFL